MKMYGKVLEIDGTPVSGATVSLVSSNGTSASQAANDAGEFDFGDADFPGSTRLVITDVAHSSQSSPVSSLGACPIEVYLSKKDATLQEVIIVAHKNMATKRGIGFILLQVGLIIVMFKVASKVIK